VVTVVSTCRGGFFTMPSPVGEGTSVCVCVCVVDERVFMSLTNHLTRRVRGGG
jgi:hypothetical protein